MTDSAETADRDVDLYAAIGRVACASAELEETLRHIIGEFCIGDEAAVLLDGQSWDWLIRGCQAILEGVYHEDFWWLKKYQSPLLSLLKEARALQEERNFVVHSTWRRTPLMEEEYIRPRPKGSASDSRVYYFIRSRRGRGLEERCLAVSDIELLAARIAELTSRLGGAFGEALAVRYRPEDPDASASV
jgi:hypothetical protein